VIAKLPPLDWRALASRLYAEGVRHFHACNTLPTPRGGLSGKPLKPLALSVVRDLRQAFGGSVVIVGGGGVTTPEDALEYREAGADHVAAGSVLLSPLRWGRLRAIAEAE
jgi:dihydroorotate dehydrogenase